MQPCLLSDTYDNGRLHTGQINVAWQLHDVTDAEGGFVSWALLRLFRWRGVTQTAACCCADRCAGYAPRANPIAIQ
eukprot:SAG11_NODE_722_length_7532_cov_6.943630_5_plen_76_part_00